MVTKARQLAEFIANADVDSDEIATGAVSASKLADTLDLSSKTIVMPDVAAFNITSGDVGIGTSSPSANLHVESTTDASIRVKNTLNSSSTSRHIELYNNDETGSLKLTVGRSGAGGGGAISTSNQMEFQTNGSERMRITSDGRVGIKNTGTDISGTSLDDVVIGAGTTVAGIVLDGGASNDTAYGFANAGTKVGRIQYINSSNSMVFQTNNANRMAIDGSGNVGIGTTSPAESLDIAGGSIRIGNSKIRHSGSGGSWDMAFETYSGGYFERMRIDSVGNVGVGTTSPDIYSFGGKILSVNGGTSYTNLVLAGDTNTGIAFGTSSARLGQITMDSTNGLTLYSQGTGNGQTMTLDRSGDVGIGTTSPATKLHVHSSGSPEIRATTGLDSNTPTMQIGYSSGSGYFLRLGDAANNEDIILRTYGNSVFNGGNVGIGTSSPDALLDIEGDFENNKALVIHSTYGSGTQHYIRTHGTQGESLAIYNSSNRVLSINPTFAWLDADRNFSVGHSGNNAQIDVWNNTAQNQTSSQSFAKGNGTKSLILTKRHNTTKDSLMGYFGSMMDFRTTNGTNTWSNGHIIGVGDPDGSGNHAGGLAFYTNPGGAAGSNVNGVNAGGTNYAAMLMTHDAQIKQPRQVAFFARPPTSYGTNGNTIIGSTWSVTNQGGPGTGSQFSTSGIFTVPTTGWYVIHWTCLVGTVTDARLDFYLTKNDTEIARSEINGYSTTSANRSGAVTGVFYLAKADYIKFGIRADAGSSTYSSSTPWAYASGYFLG